MALCLDTHFILKIHDTILDNGSQTHVTLSQLGK